MSLVSLDSLVHLPLQDWSKLQEVFKSDWPRGISGYTVLENQRKWMENGVDYGFKVFCPFGDVWNGMIAVNEKKTFYEIIIQCPTDNTTRLEEALKTTNRIDWNGRIIIPFAPDHVIDCIMKVIKEINVDLDHILPSESFILEKDSDYFEDLRLHPSVTFGLLNQVHLDLVDSKWPHRYPSSDWYFDLLIKTNSGYGLFKDNSLISWVFINEAGTLCHMYTLEEHRRHGYAELLLKIVCNKLLQEGKDVFAFAVKGNESACKLYKQAGFKNFNGVTWCYLQRKRKLNS